MSTPRSSEVLPEPVARDVERTGWLYAALTLAIWSGFVLVSRIAGTSVLSAWDVTALRFGTAALVLLPAWLLWKRVPLFNGRILTLALLGGLGYSLCVYAGFHYAPAAHAALLVPGMLPFTMALAVWIVLGQAPTPRLRRGLMLIAIGVGLLVLDTARRHGVEVDGLRMAVGDLLLVSASFCWAFYSALIRRWNIGPWETTLGSALVAALLFLPVYVLWLPHNLAAASHAEIALQAVYQGILVVIVAMLTYMQAMQRLGPARLGAFMALVPAIAGIGASLALDEPLTGWLVAGLLVTSAGAWTAARR